MARRRTSRRLPPRRRRARRLPGRLALHRLRSPARRGGRNGRVPGGRGRVRPWMPSGTRATVPATERRTPQRCRSTGGLSMASTRNVRPPSFRASGPALLVAAGLLLAPVGVLAQVWMPPVPAGCPDAPEDAVQRRSLASDFFQRPGLRRRAASRWRPPYCSCVSHRAPSEHPATWPSLGEGRHIACAATFEGRSPGPGALNLEEAASAGRRLPARGRRPPPIQVAGRHGRRPDAGR